MDNLKVNCLVCGEPMRTYMNDNEADGVECKCGEWLNELQADALAAMQERLAELEEDVAVLRSGDQMARLRLNAAKLRKDQPEDN